VRGGQERAIFRHAWSGLGGGRPAEGLEGREREATGEPTDTARQGFNAKNQAEGRMYQYLIPTYAFMTAPRPDPATCKAFVDDNLPGMLVELSCSP
jgi:hypothetical protein